MQFSILFKAPKQTYWYLVIIISMFFYACEKDAIADFSISGEHIIGTPMKFKNASQNCNSYYWSFGDGYNSDLENPVHVYTKPGVYQVRLTASGENGKSTAIKEVHITGTTYAFYNVSSVILNDFITHHHDEAGEIIASLKHGTLSPGDTTQLRIVDISEVSFQCRIGSFLISSVDKYAVVANKVNYFKIHDETLINISSESKKNIHRNTKTISTIKPNQK